MGAERAHIIVANPTVRSLCQPLVACSEGHKVELFFCAINAALEKVQPAQLHDIRAVADTHSAPNREHARSDLPGLTGAFCGLPLPPPAARGWKRIHGLPAGTKGEAIFLAVRCLFA